MLSLARVLVEAPRLLVADELSLGLAPIVVDEIYAELARLREEGTALLIVEQHVGHALELCDQVVLLEHGSVAWHGPAAEAGDRVVGHVFDQDVASTEAATGAGDGAAEAATGADTAAGGAEDADGDAAAVSDAAEAATGPDAVEA